MLPAAVAIAMVGFIGAFGSGIQSAYALDGDICQVDVGTAAGGVGALSLEDYQGNDVYFIAKDVEYGLVFRLEDSGNDHENTDVSIDSETGSARITSKMEWLDDDDSDPNIGHVNVTPPALSQPVDTVDPDDFEDSDGNPLGGDPGDVTAVSTINAWLEEVDFEPFVDDDSDSVCGNGAADGQAEGEDSWGFIDFKCIEAGVFHIDIEAPGDTEETGMTVKFVCGGQAESATIAASPTTVETKPVGTSKAESTIKVTVEDQFGDRIDGVEVTFSTDNCRFDGDDETTPAGGGTTVTTITDTDTSTGPGNDQDFLDDNPLEHSAGTAEAVLDCGGSGSSPGVAHVTAIVQREGSDIVLKVDVTVIGPTAVSGLTLTLDPDELECGEVIKATAKAVDSLGAPVSDGTLIFFTTDTSSGIVGGSEGAQGGVATKAGEASVLIATDPGNPGIHTVIAYALEGNDIFDTIVIEDDEVVATSGEFKVVAQTSATYECEGAVAPAAPTVAPPATGTGTITPPSTGDAGLASGSTSATLFVIAGAVAFILAGLASVRFARN
jgi:hypothetical protein